MEVLLGVAEAEGKLPRRIEKVRPPVYWKDLIRLEERDTKLTQYWVRIPVKGRRGGLWCAFKSYFYVWDEVELCESKLYRRDGEYYLCITIMKEAPLRLTYSSILPVDLGIRNPAASVTPPGWSRFYGRRLRQVRGWWFYLRRKLGRKAGKWRDRERRQVNDQLHKIANSIVREAERHNALIVLRDQNGIRGDGNARVRGNKRFRRLLNSWPYRRRTGRA